MGGSQLNTNASWRRSFREMSVCRGVKGLGGRDCEQGRTKGESHAETTGRTCNTDGGERASWGVVSARGRRSVGPEGGQHRCSRGEGVPKRAPTPFVIVGLTGGATHLRANPVASACDGPLSRHRRGAWGGLGIALATRVRCRGGGGAVQKGGALHRRAGTAPAPRLERWHIEGEAEQSTSSCRMLSPGTVRRSA